MSIIDELNDASSAQKSDLLSKFKKGTSLGPLTIFEADSKSSELVSLDSINRGRIIPVLKQSGRFLSLRPVGDEPDSTHSIETEKLKTLKIGPKAKKSDIFAKRALLETLEYQE